MSLIWTPVTLDFETYYDNDYSLKKLANLEYIRDPRFLIHGASIKIGDQPSRWFNRHKLGSAFEAIDWDEAEVISHNALFDMGVLYEKFGISPGRMSDTLAMCRMVLYRDLDFDLDSICRLLGIGEKGTELGSVKGLRELTNEQDVRLGGYACQDSDLEWGLYKRLRPLISDDEMEFLDLVIRMSTQGIFEFDADIGIKELEFIEQTRKDKLEFCGVTNPTELRSAPRFVKHLMNRGLTEDEIPKKISPSTGKLTYSFSKQEPAFVALHSDPRVADLVEAKLVVSSNNAKSRVERLIRITGAPPFTLPVQLLASGAHTHRLSGSGGINMQNLDNKGKLRRAIKAPKDHLILVHDMKQIELRLNMGFSGQEDVIELLRQGGDPYAREAMAQFNLPQTAIDKPKRQYGKVVQLGCGYQMGAPRFQAYCAIGPMGNPPIHITLDESYKTITTYRANHPFVVASWEWLHKVAIPMMTHKDANLEHGPIVIRHESILFPGGLALKYPGLEITEDGWIWGINGRVHRIYGGITQENIVQGLAAVALKGSMLRIKREVPIVRIAHQVHDEIISVVHKSVVEEADQQISEIMRTPLSWMPALPLDVESGYDICYSK